MHNTVPAATANTTRVPVITGRSNTSSTDHLTLGLHSSLITGPLPNWRHRGRFRWRYCRTHMELDVLTTAGRSGVHRHAGGCARWRPAGRGTPAPGRRPLAPAGSPAAPPSAAPLDCRAPRLPPRRPAPSAAAAAGRPLQPRSSSAAAWSLPPTRRWLAAGSGARRRPLDSDSSVCPRGGPEEVIRWQSPAPPAPPPPLPRQTTPPPPLPPPSPSWRWRGVLSWWPARLVVWTAPVRRRRSADVHVSELRLRLAGPAPAARRRPGSAAGPGTSAGRTGCGRGCCEPGRRPQQRSVGTAATWPPAQECWVLLRTRWPVTVSWLVCLRRPGRVTRPGEAQRFPWREWFSKGLLLEWMAPQVLQKPS